MSTPVTGRLKVTVKATLAAFVGLGLARRIDDTEGLFSVSMENASDWE